MRYFIIFLSSLILLPGFSSALAHTAVEVGPYAIEAGWGIEPPIVGIRNEFVFQVTETTDDGAKKGISNAFKNLEATAKFGGVTKILDINSDPRPGHYFADVIPTKIGSYSILFKGEINEIIVDIEVPIEDTENTSVLDFPQSSSSSSNQDVAALKSAVSSLQSDVLDIKSKVGGVETSDLNVGPAYDFAVLGLSLGAAGIILAIIAMIKRK